MKMRYTAPPANCTTLYQSDAKPVALLLYGIFALQVKFLIRKLGVSARNAYKNRQMFAHLENITIRKPTVFALRIRYSRYWKSEYSIYFNKYNKN